VDNLNSSVLIRSSYTRLNDWQLEEPNWTDLSNHVVRLLVRWQHDGCWKRSKKTTFRVLYITGPRGDMAPNNRSYLLSKSPVVVENHCTETPSPTPKNQGKHQSDDGSMVLLKHKPRGSHSLSSSSSIV
jgi:hypothetical protein